MQKKADLPQFHWLSVRHQKTTDIAAKGNFCIRNNPSRPGPRWLFEVHGWLILSIELMDVYILLNSLSRQAYLFAPTLQIQNQCNPFCSRSDSPTNRPYRLLVEDLLAI